MTDINPITGSAPLASAPKPLDQLTEKPAEVITKPSAPLVTPAVVPVVKPITANQTFNVNSGKPVPPPMPKGPDPLNNPLNRRSIGDVNADKQSNSDFLQALGANPAGVSADANSKEQIDIYVMPKEFQKHNKIAGNNSGGLVVMIVGILFLLLAGGVVYVFAVQPDFISQIFPSNTPKENPVVTPVTNPIVNNNLPAVVNTNATSTTSTQAIPEKDPKQAYTEFANVVQATMTYEDYYNSVVKYGSQKFQAEVYDDKKNKASINEESANQLLASVKRAMPNISGAEKTTIENIGADKAVLTLTLPDGNIGTVEFLLEGNSWKVNLQNWPSLLSQAVSYSAGLDDDSDSLTNKEEILLGSDSAITDTDNDGYADGAEVVALYDPMIAKKSLTENININQIIKNELSFSVLVPKAWTVSSDVSSITFTSNADDKQLFKVTRLENTNKESAELYYLRNDSDKTVDASQNISSVTWEGVMTKDFTKAYIVDKAKNHVYILEYNTGDNKTLDYNHLFNVLIKSFTVHGYS